MQISAAEQIVVNTEVQYMGSLKRNQRNEKMAVNHDDKRMIAPSRRYTNTGAAVSEYINVVIGIAIASILAIAVYGGVTQEQGSRIAMEMSGQEGVYDPSISNNGEGGYLGGSGAYAGGRSGSGPNNTGSNNSGSTSNPNPSNGGSSNNTPGNNTPPNGSSGGESSGAPGGSVGAPGGSTGPGTTPVTDPDGNPDNNPGNSITNPDTGGEVDSTPTPAPEPESPAFFSADGLGDFADGLWDGLKTQGAGLLEMILNPIDTATNFYTLGKALITDPAATLAAIRDELGQDLDAILSGDPREIGRIIGENVSPASIARIAGRLSHIARRFDNERPNIDCGRRSSFSGDTLVWTPSGLKPIRDIRVGDKVLARNDESYIDSYQKVIELYGRQVSHYYEVQLDSKTIQTTDEHPFWQQGKGWGKAQDLVEGEVLATATSDLTIRRVQRINQPLKVYNFSVANDHTYFVGEYGLWVHNMNKPCDIDKEIESEAPRKADDLAGGPLENATRVSGRFQLEGGPPNGVLYRSDNQNNITSYIVYDDVGNAVKRVDVTGAAHNGIPTPHVLDYGRNTLPDGTIRVQTPRGDPRPARLDEYP